MTWSADDVAAALALLDRPAADVAAVLDAGWDRFTDPATPTSELLAQAGVPAGAIGAAGRRRHRAGRARERSGAAFASARSPFSFPGRSGRCPGDRCSAVPPWAWPLSTSAPMTSDRSCCACASPPCWSAPAPPTWSTTPPPATLACSPTPLLGRRALRVAGAVVAAGATWAALLVDVRWAAGPGGWAPAALTLQAAALLATALTMAVLASRFAPDGRGGVAGSASVLVLALVSVALPHGWSPFSSERQGRPFAPSPCSPAGVIAFVLASLDPARRTASSGVACCFVPVHSRLRQGFSAAPDPGDAPFVGAAPEEVWIEYGIRWSTSLP